MTKTVAGTKLLKPKNNNNPQNETSRDNKILVVETELDQSQNCSHEQTYRNKKISQETKLVRPQKLVMWAKPTIIISPTKAIWSWVRSNLFGSAY